MEVFEYLEGCSLFGAFSNLNGRFSELICCPSIRLKFRIAYNGEEFSGTRSNQLVTLNGNRTVAVILSNWWNAAEFHTFPTFESSFVRLEFMRLELEWHPDKVIPLLRSLSHLPRLFSVSILIIDEEANDMSQVYELTFCIPTLKFCKFMGIGDELIASLPLANSETYTNIEYLTIEHSCSVDQLLNILSYTPRLGRLTCEKILESDTTTVSTIPIAAIPSLIHITIDECYLEFNELESFLSNTCPQLQTLRIKNLCSTECWDAARWERLISRHLSHLRILQLKYEEEIDDVFGSNVDYSQMNQFNSPFWMHRQWYLRVTLDTNDWGELVVAYSILPCRYRYKHGVFHNSYFAYFA